MVTLASDTADDPALIRDLVRRGTDLVRVNCAHDGPAAWAKMIANARAASPRPRILMDIAGPKVRTGKVTLEFTLEHIKGTHQVSTSHRISFTKPTSMGKAMEETEGATVLHVGKYGALSITQQAMDFGTSQQGLNLGN